MLRFPSGSQTGAKGRRMSEATKDTVPAQTAGDQDMQAPRDSTPPLSAEEAELVASQFKPAWETDDSPTDLEARGEVPPEPHSAEPSHASPPNADAPESDETQPPQTTQSPALPEQQAQEDAGEPQGPVDIIAEIPKRTEIEIKDEPSVVVPEEDPFEPAPVVPVAAPALVQVDRDSDRQQRQRRNRTIVVAIVAIAAVIGAIGGLKVVLSIDDKPSGPPLVQPDPADKTTSVESLPVAPAPAPSPEPSAVEEPATPTPDDTAEPTTEPHPDKTIATAKTTPTGATEGTPPKSTAPATTTPATTTPATTATTTPEPTKTAEPKPPKTASPPATGKPPPGGIVRETPF
jgi:hypothetical protein